MPFVFECPICHQPLTRPLEPLPGDSSLFYDDGRPMIPEGFFAPCDDHWSDSTGDWLVNLDDLFEVEHHPDERRNNGCCGRDGCDGPNLLCPHGHEIGTERSDCWMPRAAVLLASVVQRIRS